MTSTSEISQTAAEQSSGSSDKGQRPTHRIWLVQGDGKQADWTEVAALWPTKNGQGYCGPADRLLPIPGNRMQGRLVILPARFRPKADTAAGKGAQ